MLLKPANPYILDVKSDIINQRLYFLTPAKMPIFLQSECWQLQTDISRRENGAHVRTRIACVAGAWNLWRWKCNGDTLPVSATNNNNNGDNDNVMITIIIMVIIIIMIGDLGFSDIWFLTLYPPSTPIYSSVPPGHDLCNSREQICAAPCINWRK